jgi:copper chaperone
MVDMSHSTQTAETREHTVAGMTCSHCAAAVRDEVSKTPGVSQVDVDLASGRLTVVGIAVDEAAVRHAVAEAGYDLV